eukprot:m.102925 g.102925  ORF g.102925 m.102925 type:complete len:56 (+) comp22372_c0_seq1:580-747(+)
MHVAIPASTLALKFLKKCAAKSHGPQHLAVELTDRMATGAYLLDQNTTAGKLHQL